MLKIVIVAVGKDKDRWVVDGCAHFEKLLSRWCRIEWQIVAAPKGGASLSPVELRRAEASRLAARIPSGYLVALTDNGRQVDSEKFARLIENWQVVSGGTVVILIGGPHGLDPSLLDRADLRLSLSPMTLSHQLVRLVLLEQLYRGFSILHGTDYHK